MLLFRSFPLSLLFSRISFVIIIDDFPAIVLTWASALFYTPVNWERTRRLLAVDYPLSLLSHTAHELHPPWRWNDASNNNDHRNYTPHRGERDSNQEKKNGKNMTLMPFLELLHCNAEGLAKLSTRQQQSGHLDTKFFFSLPLCIFFSFLRAYHQDPLFAFCLFSPVQSVTEARHSSSVYIT